ncbi:MAG: hypothetical protein D6826_04570, partial [Alphaproteobacteria bacterium]
MGAFSLLVIPATAACRSLVPSAPPVHRFPPIIFHPPFHGQPSTGIIRKQRETFVDDDGCSRSLSGTIE